MFVKFGNMLSLVAVVTFTVFSTPVLADEKDTSTSPQRVLTGEGNGAGSAAGQSAGRGNGFLSAQFLLGVVAVAAVAAVAIEVSSDDDQVTSTSTATSSGGGS